MSRTLFTRIIRELTDDSPYFQQGIDCMRKVGITVLMNCISAIRQLEYDIVPEALDENMQMVEKTSRDSLNVFVRHKKIGNGVEYILFEGSMEGGAAIERGCLVVAIGIRTVDHLSDKFGGSDVKSIEME
ncbi:hypothetical protein Tco_0631738 [Tanacetum coccineum]